MARPPQSAPRWLRFLAPLLAILVLPVSPRLAPAASTTAVLSQVYAEGGDPGAVYSSDYVVLLNNGTGSISLAGWSLQIEVIGPTGPSWEVVPLCGSIPHGRYYLVALASGGPSGAALPAADCSGTVNLGIQSGVVVLASSTVPFPAGMCPLGAPEIVDLLGYGLAASCFETLPAPSPSPGAALVRGPGGPCLDTDWNSNDFIVTSAEPFNTTSPGEGCNNTAPSLDPIADVVVIEGGLATVTALASDPNLDPLTFSSSAAPAFATQIANDSWELAPGYDAAGPGGASSPMTIEATDGFETASATFMIHVVNVTTAANTPFAGRTWQGVSAATGELAFAEPPDLCLGGPRTLCFGRYYGSLIEREGEALSSLGANWLGTYDWRLVETPNEAKVVDNRGRVYRFASGGPGVWNLIEPRDAPYELTELGPEVSFAHARHRIFYIIDRSTAKLARIEDGRGNVHTLNYSGGQLATVSDGLGRVLTFTHDGFGRVTEVSDGTRSILYSYTGPNLTGVTDAAGNSTLYEYDAAIAIGGLLTARQDPLGFRPLTYQYADTDECDGCVAGVVDADLVGTGYVYSLGTAPPGSLHVTVTMPDGGLHGYAHDGGGRLRTHTDPLSGIMTWDYDALGRPTSVVRPSGIQPLAVAYDPVSGYPSTITLPDATMWQVAYVVRSYTAGHFFFPSSTTAPDLGQVQYSYDAAGNLIEIKDQANNSWLVGRNAFGQPTTITNPASGVISNGYDPQGRLTSHNDGAGTTTISYDALDRPTVITNPDASTRAFTWDPRDLLLGYTNELMKTWALAYRADGSLLRVTDPLLAVTEYEYDTMSRLTRVVDPLLGTTDFTYDPSWRLSSVTDATSRTTSFGHDLLGRLETVTNPGGNITTLGYDIDSRLTSVSDPLADVWTYGYNNRDHLTSVIDPLLNQTTFGYDAMGRITSVVRPLGLTSSYAYDLRGLPTNATVGPISVGHTYTSLGLLESHSDGEGHVWSRGYDAHGRLTSVSGPLQLSGTFTYDSRNRLLSILNPEGSVAFTYDGAGRLVQRSYSDGTSHGYTYDAVGRLLTTDGLSRTYDALGRVTEESGLFYTYDAAGRLLSETLGPGKVVTHDYEARGLVSHTTDWLMGVTSFSYDAAGRLTQITRPNGTATTHEYDKMHRLLRGTHTKASDNLGSVVLIRDALGRVTDVDRRMPLSWAPSQGSRSYAYDAESRIMGFSYDGLGRRTGDGLRSYAWDGASRADSIGDGATTIAYGYDGLSRVTEVRRGASTVELLYTPRVSPTDDGGGVRFGDGIRGTRPPTTRSVQNPYRSFGGAGAEDVVVSTFTRVSERLRHRGRAVSVADYARLALLPLPAAYAAYKVKRIGRRAAVAVAPDRAPAIGTVPSVVREAATDRTHYIRAPGGMLLHSIDLTGIAPEPCFFHFDENGNTAFLTNAEGSIVSSYAYAPAGERSSLGKEQAYPAFTWGGQSGVTEESSNGLYRFDHSLYDAVSIQPLPAPETSLHLPEVDEEVLVAAQQLARGDDLTIAPPLPGPRVGPDPVNRIKTFESWAPKFVGLFTNLRFTPSEPRSGASSDRLRNAGPIDGWPLEFGSSPTVLSFADGPAGALAPEAPMFMVARRTDWGGGPAGGQPPIVVPPLIPPIDLDPPILRIPDGLGPTLLDLFPGSLSGAFTFNRQTRP